MKLFRKKMTRLVFMGPFLLLISLTVVPTLYSQDTLPEVQEYEVPRGSRPHDVAPAVDGSIWYTAQSTGALGKLDPETGDTHHIPLGPGARPHGVIVGDDGAA
jgi:virginiamycin B lyase